MSYNSTLVDSLVRISNAQSSMLKEVRLRFSKLFLECLFLLKKEGYIIDFYVKEVNKIDSIHVLLKYYNGTGVINSIKLFSKPGRRVFVKSDSIPRYFGKLGLVVLSTSKGIFSGAVAAKMNVGGEVIGKIW